MDSHIRRPAFPTRRCTRRSFSQCTFTEDLLTQRLGAAAGVRRSFYGIPLTFAYLVLIHACCTLLAAWRWQLPVTASRPDELERAILVLEDSYEDFLFCTPTTATIKLQQEQELGIEEETVRERLPLIHSDPRGTQLMCTVALWHS